MMSGIVSGLGSGIRSRIAAIATLAVLAACRREPDAVILVSADAEWRALLGAVAPGTIESSPLGAWFARDVAFADGQRRVIFFHGGWGKIAAAASTQYVIDRWHPSYLINLGTCGGLHGRASKGDVFLVEEAITYDIEERMGDSAEAIAYYTTRLPAPRVSSAAMAGLRRGRIVSADRDVRPADATALSAKYDAAIADWESSAIAHVASRNHATLYVIRAVSDVVSEAGSEAYGDIAVFEAESRVIMKRLVDLLGDIALEP
jgi:adenosylhomocysteine nucleosidase